MRKTIRILSSPKEIVHGKQVICIVARIEEQVVRSAQSLHIASPSPAHRRGQSSFTNKGINFDKTRRDKLISTFFFKSSHPRKKIIPLRRKRLLRVMQNISKKILLRRVEQELRRHQITIVNAFEF